MLHSIIQNSHIYFILERLIHGIIQAKQILAAKLAETNPEAQEELTRQIEKVCKNATSKFINF